MILEALLVGPFVLVVVAYIALHLLSRKSYPVPPAQSSLIVITGCDSGIGKATCLAFLSKGYDVLATTFTQSGPAQLETDAASLTGKLMTIHTNIADPKSVEELRLTVADLVENSAYHLVGLVNNAGIAVIGPVEAQKPEDFIRQMDVNCFGHVRVTHALLPFLRQSLQAGKGGRIICTVSVAGRLADRFMGAYAASKFAMEAFCDSLRREVGKVGMSVTAIEPGFIHTPLLSGMDHEKTFESWVEDRRDIYKADFLKAQKGTDKVLSMASAPTLVAAAMVDAMFSATPRTRYLVGQDAKVFGFMKWILTDRMLDLVMGLVHNMN